MAMTVVNSVQFLNNLFLLFLHLITPRAPSQNCQCFNKDRVIKTLLILFARKKSRIMGASTEMQINAEISIKHSYNE